MGDPLQDLTDYAMDARWQELSDGASFTTPDRAMLRELRVLARIAQAVLRQRAPTRRQEKGDTLRDFILRALEDAHPDPVTVADLRGPIAGRFGNLHEKSPGMTLYRLSMDGLARRDSGRNWFFVPAESRLSDLAAQPTTAAPAPDETNPTLRERGE